MAIGVCVYGAAAGVIRWPTGMGQMDEVNNE